MIEILSDYRVERKGFTFKSLVDFINMLQTSEHGLWSTLKLSSFSHFLKKIIVSQHINVPTFSNRETNWICLYSVALFCSTKIFCVIALNVAANLKRFVHLVLKNFASLQITLTRRKRYPFFMLIYFIVIISLVCDLCRSFIHLYNPMILCSRVSPTEYWSSFLVKADPCAIL